MAIFLREQDVEKVLTMEECLKAVEEALKQQAEGTAVNVPRCRARFPLGALNMMIAAVPQMGAMGYKSVAVSDTRRRFLVVVHSTQTGEILAIMEADRLTQLRTGAATGVGAKYMARQNARTVGIIGSGYQAKTQLEAVCAVRGIKAVKAYDTVPEKRKAYSREMSKALGIEVLPVDSAEEAVKGSDIVVTSTTSREPVLKGEWLEEGTHVTGMGTADLARREIDEATVRRSSIVVVEHKDQAKIESGDLLHPIERGIIHWGQVYELADVVSGRVKARQKASDITLFKCHGMATWDVAVGIRTYELAKAKGLGAQLPF
ncbi:MAG: ornithine cyclodeaminase family protein [Chloroflexi bacterium]|nr:ornithine cyclodeaminase family protein [Chloroflexota bacterium]